jgi:DNA-binding transcriptional ArsR family regulator
MSMVSGNTLAEVAALIGDPARANILSALMAERALTAGELAFHAGVTAQTASGHLAKLVEARLVTVEKQGRHRYHRLAGVAVAEALEALMTIAAAGPVRYRPTGPRDEAMRAARTCYDHLAGRLGTGIAQSLESRGYIALGDGAAALTDPGKRFLCEAVGIELARGGKRPLCRLCLDWSERRPHLAGRVGAELCRRAFEQGWIERVRDSRAVAVTPIGRSAFAEVFRIEA